MKRSIRSNPTGCYDYRDLSHMALASTVPSSGEQQYSEGSRQGRSRVGGWWWGQFAVLFSVLILFAPSLLLPLTPVIYDVHPSSGRVHQLLVARRSWQQLCVARGVGLAIPLLSLGAFTRTYTPPPKKQTKKNPLV